MQKEKSQVKHKDILNGKCVVECLNLLNGIDYFLITVLLLQHPLQPWAESLMYPQLSHIRFLISICNLTVTSYYANIRYNIMRSRFQLLYKVNLYV